MSRTQASVVATCTISRDESNAAKHLIRGRVGGGGGGGGEERLVSKHIGYIPRDLSRDNWQICREEASFSRQKGREYRSLSAASEFQIFQRISSPYPSPSAIKLFLRAQGNFANSSREEHLFVRWSLLPPFYFCHDSSKGGPISIRRFLGCPKTRGPDFNPLKAFRDN